MRVVNYFGTRLLLRVVALLVISVLLGFTIAKKQWIFSQLVLGGVWLIIAVDIIRFVHQSNNRMARLIAGIRYNEIDTSVHKIEDDKAFSGLELAMSNLTKELISHKKTEQRRVSILESIIQNHPHGLLIHNLDGNIQFQNPKFTELTGVPNVKKLDQMKPYWPELLAHLTARYPINHRFDLKESNTEKEITILRYERTIDENTYAFLEVMESAHNANDEAAEHWLNLIKVVNHEIRNGITPMISLSDSLIDRIQDLSNQDLKEVFFKGLGTIKHQAQYLSDFTDTYRRIIQIPPPKKENILWKTLLDEICDVYRNKLQSIDLQLSGEGLLQNVKADKIQLIQVVSNLFSNSFRALDGVKNPSISIEIQRKKMEFMVYFSDNGAGIPVAQYPLIFIPFVSNHNEGSGIGLAVCKKILQNHGGNIWLEKDASRTTFVFTVPAV